MAPAGPNLAGVKTSIGVLYEDVLFLAGFVGRIAFFNLDTGVTHHHHFKPHGLQSVNHSFRIRKMLFIPGENLVRFHVVDVQHDGIAREITLMEVFGNGDYFFVGVVAVAALLIPHAPERGQRHTTGKPGVVVEDFLGRLTLNEVVVHFTGIGREAGESVVGGSKVEMGLMAVVEEEAIDVMAMNANIKGYGAVEGVGIRSVAVGIGVPVYIPAPPFVQRPVLFA